MPHHTYQHYDGMRNTLWTPLWWISPGLILRRSEGVVSFSDFKNTERWIKLGDPIEKRHLNVPARFLFCFISNPKIPSQNEIIVRLPKESCLGCIMHKRTNDLVLLTSSEKGMRAKKNHISLSFPKLITDVCKFDEEPMDTRGTSKSSHLLPLKFGALMPSTPMHKLT